LLDDLPWGAVSFVGVEASAVEVELVAASFGEELGATAEGFQVVELSLDLSVHGVDVYP
jgi:hypothetical protein